MRTIPAPDLQVAPPPVRTLYARLMAGEENILTSLSDVLATNRHLDYIYSNSYASSYSSSYSNTPGDTPVLVHSLGRDGLSRQCKWDFANPEDQEPF